MVNKDFQQQLMNALMHVLRHIIRNGMFGNAIDMTAENRLKHEWATRSKLKA